MGATVSEHIIRGSTGGLEDVERFVREVLAAVAAEQGPMAGLFRPGEPIAVARAPGRLDVMGGIADYSGSLVLQLPIRQAALVAVRRRPDRRLLIVTRGESAPGRQPVADFSLDDLAPGGRPIAYDDARNLFRREPGTAWAAYVAGAFLVLMREKNLSFDRGASILIDSGVPEGKGVSSSAAIEVAGMQAILAAWGKSLPGREVALLCQKVENLVVGAPCGVMDQMTAACGRSGRLLALLCQPAELLGDLEVPAALGLWGIDSGVRHSVAGADYGSVRVGAFMGYRILAGAAGLRTEPAGQGRVRIHDPLWGGFLANVAPSLLESRFAGALPEWITGREFLDRWGGITDQVTSIDPQRRYAVRAPAAHPVHEHFRVRAFSRLLAGDMADAVRLELLGELMYQSHASYSACGLGCPGTDRLVELVRQAGPARGLYGAKITGGGSGGTVAVLGRRDAGGAVQEIADRYASETGHRPVIFSGSSDGAAAFGTLTLKP